MSNGAASAPAARRPGRLTAWVVLVACLLLSVVLATVITIDGESNWLEGASLIALYFIVATAFWWG